MSELKKGPLSKLTDKLKRIKHLDIILTVLFIAIVLLIYFSSFTTSKDNSSSNTQNQNISSQSNTFDSYSNGLKSELERVIGSIYGVGKVDVMIYFDEGIKQEIAYTYETKTMNDGTKIETKSPILLNKGGSEEPIVLQEILPKPSSVVVVAGGANNTNVKLEIIRLVESMLCISSQRIEIFAGN